MNSKYFSLISVDFAAHFRIFKQEFCSHFNWIGFARSITEVESSSACTVEKQIALPAVIIREIELDVTYMEILLSAVCHI